MHLFERQLAGRRILVTGHTGFKGGWLCAWLHSIGAEVHGISLPPDTTPSLFSAVGLDKLVRHAIVDIRDAVAIAEQVVAIDPEIAFHLAAQPLVRRSYASPLETFAINIMGTAHVLDACRKAASVRSIVCVTTDKVYHNNEWPYPYREIDPLGGKDPYSASKAAAEIVAASYRDALGSPALATARGGNVIGGGDWSQDRLVPDLVRAIGHGDPMAIRNPNATRPWQHVLALCHGYLVLAAGLLNSPERHQGAWNFSPGAAGTVSVSRLLELFGSAWCLPTIARQPLDGRAEAQLLALDASKAESLLGWRCPWSLEASVAHTAGWYRRFADRPSDARAMTMDQIEAYRSEIA